MKSLAWTLLLLQLLSPVRAQGTETVELGLAVATVPSRSSWEWGLAFTLEGYRAEPSWLVGGYGALLATPTGFLGSGGGLVGVRGEDRWEVAGRLGLAGGFRGAEAGAAWQWGGKVGLGLPSGFTFHLELDRYNALPATPGTGYEGFGLGTAALGYRMR